MAEFAAEDKSLFARATGAATSIRQSLPENLRSPVVAIVCGSGLGNLQNALAEDSKVQIPYGNVDGMPKPTVHGHEGKMVFGFLKADGNRQSQVPAMLLVGRAHYYEGHSMEMVTYATRICRCLDVKIFIATNAAGGLNPEYRVGDLVLLNDHLNLAGFAGINPLRGPNESEFGVRFPALSDAYDLDLRRRAHRAWKSVLERAPNAKNKLREGVYMFGGGPNYETRAECRMVRMLGADTIGMSTVPEVIVARHSGMRVMALSLVTNEVVVEPGPSGNDENIQNMSSEELENFLAKGKANHEEVLAAGLEAAHLVESLITTIVDDLGRP